MPGKYFFKDLTLRDNKCIKYTSTVKKQRNLTALLKISFNMNQAKERKL